MWTASRIVVPLATHSAHLSVAAIPAAVLAAGSDPISALPTYGILGLVCGLLVTGQLIPKWAYDRVVAENDRLKATAESVVPTLAKTSEATAEMIALVHLLLSSQRGSPGSPTT